MEPDTFVSTLQEWIEVSMRSSMRHFIRHARESGLSMSHLVALFHILRTGSCGVTDLGDHLGVTSAASSQMLERLVLQGLILRTEDPNDRRVKQITLTDKGCRVLEEGIHARQGWMDDLAQTLSDSEKETITMGLNILIDKIKNLKQPIESES
ncbi:MAG TPA: MarR family transcriptional regulator [Anaerolineae bacterium]|nr:MarR family transcriptional regulator [Anaerolineae bacterium]